MSGETVNRLTATALLLVCAYFFLTTGPNAVTPAQVASLFGLN